MQDFVLLGLAFLASLTLSFCWLVLARRCHWFDIPNQRSSHLQPTPKGGGVGFMLVFCVGSGWLVVADPGLSWLAWLGLPALLLGLTGLLDDLRELSIRVRLLAQCLAILAGLWLLPEIPALPLPGFTLSPGWWLWPVLVLGWLWLVNLYNFMDGLDALAAVEGIFVALVIGWLALSRGQPVLGLTSLLLVVSLAGFLPFNLPPARLFMGDAGSSFLGYLLGALGLAACWAGVLNPWTLLILLGVFIVDSSVTLLSRMRSGEVWYHGHRSHAYQYAALRYGGHGRVVLVVVLINTCWLLPLAMLSSRWPEQGSWLTLIAWALLAWLVRHQRQPGDKHQSQAV